jgi:hypothetical protein
VPKLFDSSTQYDTAQQLLIKPGQGGGEAGNMHCNGRFCMNAKEQANSSPQAVATLCLL